MPISKPTVKPQWATAADPSDIAEPGSAKKALGWIVEKPPHQYANWLQWANYLWINYFEDQTDTHTTQIAQEITDRGTAVTGEASTRAAADTLLANRIALAYDAIVGAGAGCTHSTLAAALAAASAGWRILVVDNQTLNAGLTISLTDIEIELKTKASIIAGTATTGITVSAANFTLRGGKMTGFSTAAVNVGAGGTGSMLRDIRFSGNSTDVLDASDLASVVGCI